MVTRELLKHDVLAKVEPKADCSVKDKESV